MAISRSKWDSFIKCPLCFYLKEKHNIDPPSTPRFTINMRVDNLLKEEFDELRAKGEPHPIFKEYNLNFVPYNGLSPETSYGSIKDYEERAQTCRLVWHC